MFLVIPKKGMAYTYGSATKITVCIENDQHPFLIESGEKFSIVAKNFLETNSPSWKNRFLPTKEKHFKIPSGKMNSIGTLIKEIIIPHREGNIILNLEFLVLGNSQIQEFLLGTD
ncbi:hypothetical protein O181_044558 [Austropuccinia psidii MF-1]|uniref:Uncharacterized protein n=1 Tax=Austropuccinia psidii MF-1 TaxID=1389203 RepID=A0A9Q3DNJ4_9BASI|nr:hypothetical protein [Austropuccinia psidii MF-1]